MREQGLIA